MKLLTAAEMAEADRRAVEEIGIPIECLLENAGRAVADGLLEAVPDLAERSCLIVCGRGHNGGDGLVAARHLMSQGLTPQVLLLGRIRDLKNEVVRRQAAAVRNLGIPLIEAPGPGAFSGEGLSLADFDVLIDAVAGTGLRPPLRGLEAAAVAAINDAGEAGSFVLAIDLPSGLDADTGRIPGPAVAADLTVTFAAPKRAHFLAPAEELCGHLVVADITLPRSLLDLPRHRVELVDREFAEARVLPRRPGAHKGSFGHLLVVAGSRGRTGAAILAARAALRAGAGLVTVATPASCLALVAQGCPEAMTAPLPETAEGGVAAAAAGAVRSLLAERDALAIGPGLGAGPEVKRLLRGLLPVLDRPALLDADALNVLRGGLPALRKARVPLILTPHPGEAARLLASTAREINDDRLASARELSRRSGAVVLLKGHRSITAAPGGELWLNLSGNPGMATAGTGDALTGVIASLLVQGLGHATAAALGAYVHGLAGDLAAERGGEQGLVASDLVEALPLAFRSLLGAPADQQHDGCPEA